VHIKHSCHVVISVSTKSCCNKSCTSSQKSALLDPQHWLALLLPPHGTWCVSFRDIATCENRVSSSGIKFIPHFIRIDPVVQTSTGGGGGTARVVLALQIGTQMFTYHKLRNAMWSFSCAKSRGNFYTKHMECSSITPREKYDALVCFRRLSRSVPTPLHKAGIPVSRHASIINSLATSRLYISDKFSVKTNPWF
jgi:hypothetical protein